MPIEILCASTELPFTSHDFKHISSCHFLPDYQISIQAKGFYQFESDQNTNTIWIQIGKYVFIHFLLHIVVHTLD